MKRTLFVLSIIILTANISKAQYNKTRTFIFAEGAINMATFYQSAGNNTVLNFGNVFRPDFSLYFKAKYPTFVGFDAGLSFSQLGAKFSDSLARRRVFNDSLSSRVNLNYVSVFGDGLYYFELEGNNDITAGFGLYVAYALSGKRDAGSVKPNIDFGNNWKRLDYGLRLKASFNFHDFATLGVQYRVAFPPVLKTLDANYNANNGRNSVFTLSAAIRLIEFKNK